MRINAPSWGFVAAAALLVGGCEELPADYSQSKTADIRLAADELDAHEAELQRLTLARDAGSPVNCIEAMIRSQTALVRQSEARIKELAK